jgi:hypothetical protein
MKKLMVGTLALVVLLLGVSAGPAVADHSRGGFGFGFSIGPPAYYSSYPSYGGYYRGYNGPGYYGPGYYGRAWVPGHWTTRWTPYGWQRVWVRGYWS